MNLPFAFDLSFNPFQMLIIGAIAVLLFGKRLPEVGRSVGKGLFELRKGLRSIEDIVHNAGTSTESGDYTPERTYQHHAEDHDEATAPKFEPPPQPKRESAEVPGNGGSIGGESKVVDYQDQ